MKDVHITDLNSKVNCPRRWDFESLLRRGLQRAMIPKPLFTGQVMHVGLGRFYTDGRDVDAGIEDMKTFSIDRARAIAAFAGPLWGNERDVINESFSLCKAMLPHYALWSRKRDENYEFIASECRFIAPIPIPRGMGNAGDSRNRFDVKLGRYVSGQIQLAGRFDGVVRDKRDDKLYLLEFKTARSLKTAHWTMRGLQGTAYVYAASIVYDMPIDGILYRILRKAVPSRPDPLQRGGFSQRKDQKTTFEYFKHCLDQIAANEGVDPRQLYRENEKVLRELHGRRRPDGNDFFMERLIHKHPATIESTLRAVYFEGMRMADPNVDIYATPGWNTCNNCPFKDPCDLLEMGYAEQAEALLESEYAPRNYWEADDANNQGDRTANGVGTKAA